MADECVFSAHDMLEVVRTGAADVVSLKLVKHGGSVTLDQEKLRRYARG
jgi:muconate cycloisomerase